MEHTVVEEEATTITTSSQAKRPSFLNFRIAPPPPPHEGKIASSDQTSPPAHHHNADLAESHLLSSSFDEIIGKSLIHSSNHQQINSGAQEIHHEDTPSLKSHPISI